MSDSKMRKKSCLAGIAKSFINLIIILCFFLSLLIAYLFFSSSPVAFNEEAAKKITYTPLEKLVPGDKLPTGLKLGRSNNNLDLTQFKGRYYFAFRTAPTHFASTETIIYVLSSKNLEKWEYETEFNLKDDLREPRFLVFKNKLILYFFRGGSNPLAFAPKHIYATERTAKGKWTEPKEIYEPGYVDWRAKVHNGKAYMSVYYGAGLYTNENEPGSLRLLVSDDGYNYRMVGGKEARTKYSSEEGEFEFDNKGNLWATVRLEMLGGEVCFAPKKDLSAWDCKFTNYKFDSALMFRRKGEFYVVARRNIDGPYNKQSKLIPSALRSKLYLVRYSGTRKRTALYRLNKEKKELEPLFDFPSRGDTAYAGITQLDENKYLLFNYSCDIDGFDWSWIFGQLIGTNIYSTVLEFRD